ncbi:hypothetical protein GGS26DRAFT_54633 [Hypomontagnella submonticulosa]|nr:hypothetical protein GGS26DRAFT_54633 [Hypomontagnella submonticulosa]
MLHITQRISILRLQSLYQRPVSGPSSYWADLPPKIRYQILDILLHDGCSLAGFTTVSREWQAVIEPHNFSRINLTPLRIAHPESAPILHRKRDLIHYICFRVELRRYDCTDCGVKRRDHFRMHIADERLSTEAIQSLFSLLSRWKSNGDLVLDVSVFSPSDSEHHFKYLDFRPDVPPGNRILVKSLAPGNLRKLVIFENFNLYYPWSDLYGEPGAGDIGTGSDTCLCSGLGRSCVPPSSRQDCDYEQLD